MTEQNSQLENTLPLPENLRQQYLKLMGIQTWFDPQLVIPAKQVVSEKEVPAIEQPANEVSAEFAAEKNNAKETEANLIAQHVNASSENVTETSALKTLDALALKISQCELCELHTHRQQAISGEGDVNAKIFIIIDAPVLDSESENALLNAANKKMLQAMLQTIGLALSTVFISSLVKCRPPEDRAPQTSEMICCDDHLSAQIKLIQPDVIMVLGEGATQQLLVSQKSLTDLRLRDHKHLGIPVYASYHPEDLFNSSETKRKVWADLLQIKQHLT